jgi:hypothetical protein
MYWQEAEMCQFQEMKQEKSKLREDVKIADCQSFLFTFLFLYLA